jgi:alkylation response protein AidB-like acyl-CoA dehydrogenase
MFILDMHSPGVTVQALPNMAGIHSFNQCFFDDVRIPRENLIGEQNRGWYLSAETLDFERSSIANFAGVRRSLEDLVEDTKARRLGHATRFEVAELWMAMEVGYMMAYHVASMQERGLIPNKEASVVKLFSSELSQRLAACALRVRGTAGQAEPGRPIGSRPAATGYLASVSATIGGGTSEIQRNVIATRGLGLPRG